MDDSSTKSKARVGLPKLDIGLAEPSQHFAPVVPVVDNNAVAYPLMAPPHFELENTVGRFFHERKIKLLSRFEISWERITMFLPMFAALLVSCIIPGVPQLEKIWTTQYSPLFPVFTIFLIRRDLRGCLRNCEYMILGACIGAAFSIAVSHITHNMWAVWGFWSGLCLLMLLIHSLGPVDFVRLTWPKIALISSCNMILFNTNLLCDTCEFNMRVLRIGSVFVIPPIIYLVCNAVFAANGGEWHLPRHFHEFLKKSHHHITLMHRRLQHSHYLILTRHAADEAEYEALLAVQATLQAEATEMTALASETAARLQLIRNLVNTGRIGDFSKTEIIAFYADFLKQITKLHHSLLSMRVAQLNEFPGKLDPRFLLRWYEVWTPFLDFLLQRLDAIAKNIYDPRQAKPVDPGQLAERRAELMRQYYGIVQAYLRNHGGRFPAETARVNLMVLALDSAAGTILKMEEIDWAAHARMRSSLLEHRLRIFGSVLGHPFRDLYSVAKVVVLFVAVCAVTLFKWVRGTHTQRPSQWLGLRWRDAVAYVKSPRWHFAVRFTFALSAAAAFVLGVQPRAGVDLHGIWLLTTINLVMLETVGGTITRCLNRVLGTIGAGVIGYVTVSITFALDNSIWRALWLYAVAVPLVFFCLYLWAHSRGPYTWQVTLLTFFLIGFSNESASHSIALEFAGRRVLAIAVGTVWAAIVTALIWPQYAASQLHNNCFSSIRAFHKAFDRMLRLTVGWSRREEKADLTKTRHTSLDLGSRPLLASPSLAPKPLPSPTVGRANPPASPSAATMALRESLKIKIPKADETPPAEAFKRILQTLEMTVAQQTLLADDTRLERWSPPARDLPALMLPFFRRTLRILECAGLLLRTPLPPELYQYLRPLKQVTTLLHVSVKESQKHIEAALDRRDEEDLREFVPPASRSKQFDEIFAGLTRRLGVAFHEKFLADFLRLSALLVLQKELVREWDHVVLSVLLQDRKTVTISTADGAARTVEAEPAVGFVARQLPVIGFTALQKAASKVAGGLGLTPRGERVSAEAARRSAAVAGLDLPPTAGEGPMMTGDAGLPGVSPQPTPRAGMGSYIWGLLTPRGAPAGGRPRGEGLDLV